MTDDVSWEVRSEELGFLTGVGYVFISPAGDHIQPYDMGKVLKSLQAEADALRGLVRLVDEALAIDALLKAHSDDWNGREHWEILTTWKTRYKTKRAALTPQPHHERREGVMIEELKQIEIPIVPCGADGSGHYAHRSQRTRLTKGVSLSKLFEWTWCPGSVPKEPTHD